MIRGTVTLRNYRCFDWDNPMRLEFCDGFVALIGPNNSGKSSALRAIYELRPLFQNIFPSFSSVNGFRHHPGFQFVSDPSELANDGDPNRFQVSVDLPTQPSGVSPEHIVVRHLTVEFRIRENCFVPIRVVAEHPRQGKFAVDERNVKDVAGLAGEYLVNYVDRGVADFRDISAFCVELANSRYYPAFRNAINEGAGVYYDIPVGTSLVGTWNGWKAGNARAQKLAIAKVEAEIASLLGFRTLQINADQSDKTLDVIINNRPHKLYEVGAGVAQLIITFAAALVSKPPYILIDEPELNLHPSLQLQFLTALASYAQHGVIYATHSIGLARSTTSRIYCISKQPDGPARIQPFGEHSPNFSEWLGELSYSSRLDIGCEGIILVEGPSEVLCFQEFLRKLGKDHEYVLIQLGGSSLINDRSAQHLAEITRLVEPRRVHVFVDSERDSEGATVTPDRQAFMANARSLGFHATASDRRATENYFPRSAIQRAFGPEFDALTPFQRLKDAPRPWPKANNFKIAREMQAEDLNGTDLGQFLAQL